MADEPLVRSLNRRIKKLERNSIRFRIDSNGVPKLDWQGGSVGLGSGEGTWQPLDTDLSAIALLTTTTFGRNLLTLTNLDGGDLELTNIADATQMDSAITLSQMVGGLAQKQGVSAVLNNLASLTRAADKGIYFDSATSAATYDLTAYGRSLAAVATELAFKQLVNLEIGVDVAAASHAHNIADINLLQLALDAKINLGTIDAKGDLLVGSANTALDNLAVGTNGHVLQADSAQTLGVKWDALAISQITGLQSALDGKQPYDATLADLANTNPGTFGISLLEALTQAAAYTLLGVGAASGIAPLNASGYVAVARGGTAAGNVSDARTNLGLAIGTHVQAWDATLDTLAAIAVAAYGANLLTYASETAFKQGVNLEIGVDVQAQDAGLQLIANGTVTSFGQSLLELADGEALEGLLDDLPISKIANLQANLDAKLDESLMDFKGDLIVASGNDVPARLGVGTNGYLLVADSTQTLGVKWAAPGDHQHEIDDVNSLQFALDSKIPTGTIDAKGDLLVGTSDNNLDNLAAGTNGQYLIVDDTTATGLKWGPLSSHSHAISDVTNLQANLDAKLDESVVDAKGDLIGASGNDTPVRVPVAASDGMNLESDSTQTSGMKWAFPAIPDAPDTAWRNIAQGHGTIGSSVSAATWFFCPGRLDANITMMNSPANVISLGASVPIFYLAAADWAITGYTLELRIRIQSGSNGTAPGVTYDGKLVPVTFSGGSAQMIITAGTPVGNTATGPTIVQNSGQSWDSSAFSFPSNYRYTVVVVSSGSMASGSMVHLSFQLQLRYVPT